MLLRVQSGLRDKTLRYAMQIGRRYATCTNYASRIATTDFIERVNLLPREKKTVLKPLPFYCLKLLLK
jgi:hypothetical protein